MRRLFLCLLIFSVVIFVASLALAMEGELKLPRYVIAGGGDTSGDGVRFALTGAIGQAVAGHSEDGSRFEVESGFFGGLPVQEVTWKIYLPLIEQR